MSHLSDIRGLSKLPFLDCSLPIHTVDTSNGPILFHMYGSTTEFRVRTFHCKEPETLAWIDLFKSGTVFWDIGANIGVYSLYAAARKDLRVFSFEPSPINYYLLLNNLLLNNFDNMTALPFCLSNVECLMYWSPDLNPGSADNQIDKVGPSAIQSFTIDQLVSNNICFPNYIKIDVDGLEHLILRGALDALKNKNLLSVMVEVDERSILNLKSVTNLFHSNGFGPPVTRHPPYYDGNHYLPSSNYIFRRI